VNALQSRSAGFGEFIDWRQTMMVVAVPKSQQRSSIKVILSHLVK
jgi:hypothetical protein